MKYRNLTKKVLTIPGIGKIEAEGVFETDQEIRNRNIQPVKEEKTEEKNHK